MSGSSRVSAEELPLRDASIDVALVNGIFNLNPFRERIFRELARVLKVDGIVAGAELILPSHAFPGDEKGETRTGSPEWPVQRMQVHSYRSFEPLVLRKRQSSEHPGTPARRIQPSWRRTLSRGGDEVP